MGIRPRANPLTPATLAIALALLLAPAGELRAVQSSYSVAALVSAREFFQSRQLDPALRSVRESLKLDPDNWEAHQLEARILFALRRHDEATRSAEKAEKLAPEDRKEGVRELIRQIDRDKPRTALTLRGTVFFDPWEVFAIDGDRDALYLKNPVHDRRAVPALIAGERFALLQAFMSPPGDTIYSPLGRQPEFESVADRACGYARLPGTAVTAISSAELERELPAPGIDPAPRLSARHSMIHLTEEDRIEVAAAVISCKDPARKRYRLAQQRAGLIHVRAWSEALNRLVTLHKQTARRTAVSPEAARVAEARVFQLLTKASHTQVMQLKALEGWLGSGEALLTLSKEQAKDLRAQVTDALERSRFELKRMDRHPTSSQLVRDDLLFIQYLYRNASQ